MPELPEVVTTVKFLKERIKNSFIKDVWTNTFNIFKEPKFDLAKEILKDKKILEIKNRGKYIIFELSNDYFLILHQKLSGHLLLGKWKIENNEAFPIINGPIKDDPRNLYLRVILFLSYKFDLGLCDVRKFSSILIGRKELIERLNKNIGANFLEISFENFYRCLFKKRKIKQVLMDQKCFSGIGNIYSDEALWESKINPNTLAIKLDKNLAKILFENMRKILKKAISLKGTSISDYRLPNGKIGLYGFYRKVYKRKNCKRCGSKIERVKINQRFSYFCPICQIF